MLDGKITTNNAKNATRVTTTKNAVCGAITTKDTTHGILTAYAPYDHNQLYNRETSDQHPIEAITGLRVALDAGSAGLSEAKEEFNTQLAHEADLRHTADQKLAGDLSDEAGLRQTADQKLADDLANEKATREAAIESAIDTSKTYVDDNFVQKVTTPAIVYATTAEDGSPRAISWNTAAVPNTVVMRDNSGRTRVEDPADQNDATTKKYVDDADAKKLNLTGGTIAGSLAIQGDLTVAGTTTTETAQTLAVKDSVIVTNADGAELGATLSGIAIRKDGENTYGVMYDPSGDSVKLGLGTLDAENKFTFNESGTDGKPIATRADSSELTDGDLVKWDGTTNSLVDSGKKTDDFVEKVTVTEGSNLAYVAKNNGTQGTIPITTAPASGTIAQRKQNGGALEVGTAVGDSDAMPKKQVEDGFVAKIGTETQAGAILYGRTHTGEERGFVVGAMSHKGNTIVQRKSDGTVEVYTPSSDNDATTKEYVDSALDKKLDTYTGTAFYPVIPIQKQISASNPSAGYTQAWEQMSDEAINNTVAKRTKNGTVATAIPKSDKDATPKKYVEDNFIPKSTFTDAWQVLVTGENSNIITTRGMSGDPSGQKIVNFDSLCRLQTYNPDGTAPTEKSDRYVVNVGYANAKYVARTTQTNVVYGTGNNGDVEYTHFAYNPVAWNITKFDGTGCLRTNDPTGDDGRQCVNKQYADKSYVAKRTTTAPNESYLYAYDSNGDRQFRITGSSIGNSVPFRDDRGRIQVGTPVGVNDATTKAYVDNLNTITITAGA